MDIARDTFILNPKKWGGPVIKKGDRINAVRSEAGKWLVNAGGAEWPMTDEEVNRKFHADAAPEASGSAWVEKFTGRNKASSPREGRPTTPLLCAGSPTRE